MALAHIEGASASEHPRTCTVGEGRFLKRSGCTPTTLAVASGLRRPHGPWVSPSSGHRECDRRGDTRGNLERADTSGIRSARSHGPEVPCDRSPPIAPPRLLLVLLDKEIFDYIYTRCALWWGKRRSRGGDRLTMVENLRDSGTFTRYRIGGSF